MVAMIIARDENLTSLLKRSPDLGARIAESVAKVDVPTELGALTFGARFSAARPSASMGNRSVLVCIH